MRGPSASGDSPSDSEEPWAGEAWSRIVTANAGEDLVALLSWVAGGSLEARIDGAPFAVLNGRNRELTIDLARLAPELPVQRTGIGSRLVAIWELRGLPSALARSGWQVSLRDGSHELVRMGRSASALTGHVHVSPGGWRRWRRLP